MQAARARFWLRFLGVPLLAALLPSALSAGEASAPRLLTPLARAQARYLVICLDGVGYDLVAEMYARGELRHFQPPAPLIAPFPTLTNLGLVEALAPLGAPPARGYEDYYFDPRANRMRGGFFERFRRSSFIAGTYRENFHFHPNLIGMTFEYSLPVLGPWLGGQFSLDHVRRKFLRSRQPVFLAYLDSTDPGAHISGKWMVRDVLRRLDRMVGELRRTAPTPVEVVLFSDHGNDFTRFRKAELEEPLERAGFRIENKLRDAHSVVIPAYGLVGTAVLYTQPGQEARVAEALAGARGVELIAWRSAEVVHVLGAQGRARILRRGSLLRYEAEAGDPLALEPLAAQLADQADSEGFLHEDTWLAATAGHIYPDPLRRLWHAFEDLVEQPASVIVSLADGYYTGSFLLDLLAVLRATHGNLRRSQSYAFVMSTAPAPPSPMAPAAQSENGPLPRVLRTRDLWPYITRQREQAWGRLQLPPRPCLTTRRGPASRLPADLLSPP